MPSIQKSKVVPYGQQQMYDLVNDIARYAEFVPWCVNSKLISSNEDEIRASLEFAKGGLHKSFSTVNRLKAHKMIEIRLIDGPFQHLDGFWRFDELTDHQTRVSLDLDFEFSSKLLGMMFGPLFNQVAATLVDVFCQRAEALYGSS